MAGEQLPAGEGKPADEGGRGVPRCFAGRGVPPDVGIQGAEIRQRHHAVDEIRGGHRHFRLPEHAEPVADVEHPYRPAGLYLYGNTPGRVAPRARFDLRPHARLRRYPCRGGFVHHRFHGAGAPFFRGERAASGGYPEDRLADARLRRGTLRAGHHHQSLLGHRAAHDAGADSHGADYRRGGGVRGVAGAHHPAAGQGGEAARGLLVRDDTRHEDAAQLYCDGHAHPRDRTARQPAREAGAVFPHPARGGRAPHQPDQQGADARQTGAPPAEARQDGMPAAPDAGGPCRKVSGEGGEADTLCMEAGRSGGVCRRGVSARGTEQPDRQCREIFGQ